MKNLLKKIILSTLTISTPVFAEIDQSQESVDGFTSIDYSGPVGQQFIPQVNAISSFQIQMADPGGTPGVGSEVQLVLHEGGLEGDIVAVSETTFLEDCFNFEQGPGCGIGGGFPSPINFGFDEAVSVAAGTVYTLELILLEGADVGVGYSYQNTYNAGALITSGSFQPGDMAFTTHYTTATQTVVIASSSNTLFKTTLEGDLIDQTPIDAIATPYKARDLIDLGDGGIAIFNGVFEPSLSTLSDGLWSHHQYDGWSIVNNLSYGGIAASDNFLYLGDMLTYNSTSSQAKGIIKVDRNDFTSYERFFPNDDFIDLTIGDDGLLYGLKNTYGALLVINPGTMEVITSINLGASSGSRGAAADEHGNIYIAKWNGSLSKYDALGTEVSSVNLGGNLSDIDIKGNQILVSGRFGDIHLLDLELQLTRTFSVTSSDTFVAFAEAPIEEPEPNYCPSTANNTNYEWIESIELADSLFSTGGNGGYIDHGDTGIELLKSESSAIVLQPGYGYGSYREHWNVWIDLNQNGEFESQELMVNANGYGTLYTPFNIPATALTGSTRMRVSMKYGSYASPCSLFTYGEVEDLQITIQ